MDAVTVFVRVVEAGSFAAAAKRLGMPKTTVSAKVAGLEKRLGVNLIQRTTRKLRMTDVGEKYFHHCAIAAREIELGEAALQSAKVKPSGVLKVTAPIDLGHVLLPRIAQAYTARYPDVSLELILTNRVVDLVEEGVDLAIRWAGALKDSSLIARRFIETDSNLWASPKYLKKFGKPSHPRDLVNAAFLAHPVLRTVMLTNGRSDFELQLNGRTYVDDLEVVAALVVLGEGIAWLPDFLVRDAAAAGKLGPVLSQWRPKQYQNWTYYFVYAGRRYTLPKVESFIQTALAQI
ncbi:MULTISPECIES: LysR family transcriptional regulator [Bradyrhizobium]|jgi:DNA-binding transcriptional LysR family regulator|uniref:LysR family transcriptional regulator n=1 Tax=Bradyrhizobium TaxID=374 RepID=UPI00048659B1|nr:MULTISPECIES: LysR family transcriptional regulator [Bradyrhizobium]QOG23112.1 LysR family transcriptional regulator [Bradyrhizobium sp. SEMIA]UFW53483.1 LysR substrate-binding domain-containing protein [Bradyrhizobium arachidis]